MPRNICYHVLLKEARASCIKMAAHLPVVSTHSTIFVRCCAHLDTHRHRPYEALKETAHDVL